MYYPFHSTMIPQRTSFSYPHFADEETEAEMLHNLLKLPDLIRNGLGIHPSQMPKALTFNHVSVYSTQMFSYVYGQQQWPK